MVNGQLTLERKYSGIQCIEYITLRNHNI